MSGLLGWVRNCRAAVGKGKEEAEPGCCKCEVVEGCGRVVVKEVWSGPALQGRAVVAGWQVPVE